MKIRDLIKFTLGTALISMVIFSCSDDFSEKDLLQAQYDLAAKQDSIARNRSIEALNKAGELVSFQIKVVDTDGTGIEGLEVTLGAASEGGVPDNQTLTTDASGLVYFDRVAIGGNSVNISGGSIIDAVLSANFGEIEEGKHYQIIDNNIIPTPVTENAIITVISNGTATATVQGNVKIETDVTNTTSEVPQDVVLYANFDDNLVETASISLNYFFATNDNALSVGMATVDNTTGDYTMTVPAGVQFDVLIPDVQFAQRIAVNEVNNQVLPRPEYRDIITNFGDTYNSDFNTPSVIGARVVFDMPAEPGDGFTFGGFSRIGRSIPNFSLNKNAGDPITEPYEDASDIVTQFTNLGAGYIASPTVTITDANGTGAYAEAWIEFAITGLTLTDAGTGYAASTTYAFDLYYDEIADADGNINTDQLEAFSVINIDTDGAGVFQSSAVASALADAISNGFSYFDASNLQQINDNISNLRLVNTDATTDAIVTVSSTVGRVYALDMVDLGDDYTNPSFTFSGGGGTTQAVMNVLQFGTQWTVDVDNSGITTPYPLLPSVMELEYYQVSANSRSVSQTSNVFNIETGSSNSFSNLLKTDGSGDIQWVDQTANYKTIFFSAEAPRASIIRNEANIAEAFISTGAIDNNDGSISFINVNTNGSGYTDRFGVIIEPSAVGAPGSGATIELRGGTFLSTGEYSWGNDYNITNEGSGFLDNLNQVNSDRNFIVNGTTSSSPYLNRKLNAGQTYILDIDYGTGVRTETIN